LLGASAIATTAFAQQWPVRPLQVISPFVAGTTNDLVTSTVLDQVGRQIGQQIVLENRPGGDGTVGVASVVRANPDGYTLLLSSSSMSAAVILHKSLPYDMLRDLEPVAMFGGQPSVLAATPGKGFKSVADLVAAAKSKPGELKFASVGIGSASYLAAERFRLAAGLNVQHAPYSGPVQALDDLMAGRVDFYFVPIAPAVPLVAQGKMVALAVSSSNHSFSLPGVQTLAEAGYPIPEYLVWDGLMAPAKTPAAIVTTLNDAIGKALVLPAIRNKLQRFGVEPRAMSPDEFAKFFAEDIAATTKLGKDANIQPLE
jgi:tripartite-type tricarboxylate transporter receptor subunit TctC